MTTVPTRRKYTIYKQTKRGAMNKGGHSGTRHRKRHTYAAGPPGSPNGVCLGGKIVPSSKKGEPPRVCQCGKHNGLEA